MRYILIIFNAYKSIINQYFEITVANSLYSDILDIENLINNYRKYKKIENVF